MNEPLLITTTLENQDDAEHLAKILLREKLVACAQINGPVKSLYWWKDEIAESVEFVLSLKTVRNLYDSIEQIILKEHPYDVPEIVATDITEGSREYLTWLKDGVRK